MSTQNISKKFLERILTAARSMDNNEMRFMYLLRNLGPQQFEKLIEYSGLSRSTVSKYLKLHEKHENIEKRLIDGKKKYCITDKGIGRLQEKPNINEIFYQEFDETISTLSEMLDFYKQIGVPEYTSLPIVKLISKIGKSFFQLEQNRDLYVTLIYIFFNSVITPTHKLRKQVFCEHYNIKQLRLDYHVDQIMANNLGFFMFTRLYGENEDIFFFHEEDIVGITTLRLVKDKLAEIIIHLNNDFQKRYKLKQTSEKFAEIHNIDLMAKEIAKRLNKMKIIWARDDPDIAKKMRPQWELLGEEVSDDEKQVIGIIEPFEMLIEKIIVKNALDMGFSRTFLTDLVAESKLLTHSKEGLQSLINIIDGSERYEDLNLVSIESTVGKIIGESLENIKGFCKNCGKTIEKQDHTNVCPRCKQEFDPEALLTEIAKANEKITAYKKRILETSEHCPNCNEWIMSSWDECPFCHTTF